MTNTGQGKRLKILTTSEIQELYGLPRFSYEERVRYFFLNPLEHQELFPLRSTKSKVLFILQLGYFKAKNMFFSFQVQEVKEDLHYILHHYFPQDEDLSDLNVSKSARLAQQDRILTLLNYRMCTQEIKQELQKKAQYLVTIDARSIYVLKALVNYLESHRIVIPGYSFMQEEIVGKALMAEKRRLGMVLTQWVNDEEQQELDQLMNAEDGLYELTFLKKDPKDFSYKEITLEVKKVKSLKPLYRFAKRILPKLQISNENIKYYASLVDYYTVYKLRRMQRKTAYVYLSCFIFSRFQKIHDNLVNTFLYYVHKYMDEAKKVAQEKVYLYKTEGNKHLKKAGKILDLFIDADFPEDIAFQRVKEIAFSILDKEKFSLVSRYISKAGFDIAEYEWDHYIKLSRQFKLNLRSIFLNIEFECLNSEEPLLKAVSFLKDAFCQDKSLRQINTGDVPQEFIPTKFSRYLYDIKAVKIDGKTRKTKVLHVDKYEFLVYRLVKRGLEAGDMFVRDSLNYKSFEEDLIDNEQWKNKEEILQTLDLPYLNTPIRSLLASLRTTLTARLHGVNARIKTGDNTSIKLTGKGDHIRWSLPYKKDEESNNNPIYDSFPQVGIRDILRFVDQQCACMSSFTHILDRYVKTEADNHHICACVVAQGTNVGLLKMSEISDINYQALVSTSSNFIRLETLKQANDQISNAMAKLSIFTHYNLEEETIHSSSDGQRYETQFETINARYSPKYFGLKKGITSYTLVANHIPINAKIIGTNEHESHYVFDILYNNTSEILPKIHSTDTHGTNEVNFGILYLFGYIFAPRYRKLRSKAKKIYSFDNPNHYEGLLIKPIRKIRTTLVEEEWDNVLRIMVSLALKSTTQSTIIRKLSSYARKNKTKRALWEFDNIIKTLYILAYVDSSELRRNIQKALNRGEFYHKLRKAVFHDNFGKFRVKTELEQRIWSECTRLITNSIIFFNAFILSKLLDQKEKMKRCDEADLIKRISPIAWRHINLYGRYEFYREHISVNVEEIIHTLSKAPL